MDQHSNRPAANAPHSAPDIDALDADGFGASYTPPPQQHLVVECRTDDRWKVALCTTLDDLDAALDTARALRANADIDEVCLALETAGSQGREVRREVIRLGAADRPASEPATASATAPAAVADGVVEADAAGNDDFSAILPAIKAPDYTIDEEILDALDPQPALSAAYAPEKPVRPAPEPPKAPAPHPVDDGPSEADARAAARALVNSLYGLNGNDGENGRKSDGDGALVDFHDEPPMDPPVSASHEDEDAPGAADTTSALAGAQRDAWLDDLDKLPPSGWASASRLEAEDNRFDAAARLERPLIGDPSGMATKTFIVAGTLAMMVLGGALAELMAIDITASAEAGTDAPRPAAIVMNADER